MDDEVAQLERLGAAVARRHPDHVAADPEGSKSGRYRCRFPLVRRHRRRNGADNPVTGLWLS
jgi:hypothetical protein